MTNETIADIVAEMRTHASGSAESAWYTPESWDKLCDRLEMVDRRLNDAYLDGAWKIMTSYHESLSRAWKEVERLRAALKPVMECDCKVLATRQLGDKWFTMSDDEFVKLCKVTEAVRAAQEIMKGEMK